MRSNNNNVNFSCLKYFQKDRCVERPIMGVRERKNAENHMTRKTKIFN